MLPDTHTHGPAWAPGYRHLTRSVPPVPFSTREELEDFRVWELPSTEPCGESGAVGHWKQSSGLRIHLQDHTGLRVQPFASQQNER